MHQSEELKSLSQAVALAEFAVAPCFPWLSSCHGHLNRTQRAFLIEEDLHPTTIYIRCRCAAGLGHLPHSRMQMYIRRKYNCLLKCNRPSHHIAAWNNGVEWIRMTFLRNHSPPAAAAEEMDAVELPQPQSSRWRPWWLPAQANVTLSASTTCLY